MRVSLGGLIIFTLSAISLTAIVIWMIVISADIAALLVVFVGGVILQYIVAIAIWGSLVTGGFKFDDTAAAGSHRTPIMSAASNVMIPTVTGGDGESSFSTA